jgi:hypothetical protein
LSLFCGPRDDLVLDHARLIGQWEEAGQFADAGLMRLENLVAWNGRPVEGS